MRLRFHALVLVAACLCAHAARPSSAAPRAARPNIVILLADDLGYADVGVHGCTDVPTPHIDTLAAGGVRFTAGYATNSGGAASRAGLMSGMYPYRFGFEMNPGSEETASNDFGLPASVPTLAEKLRAAGYATGMVGKWHLGYGEGLRPHERGFDTSFAFLGGAHSYLPRARSSSLYRDGVRVRKEHTYLTQAFARESIAFIDAHHAEPFFLYVAFNAVHTPMQPPRDYRERFPDLAESPRRQLAGMHAEMDDAIGEILAALRRHELEESTLVFFYSDNGGIPAKNASRNAPLRGTKGQLFEGGIRVPFLVQWKGTLPAGKVVEQPVMGFDVHATALAAAQVDASDAPPIDGVDLVPFLTGATDTPPHERLFWRDGKEQAARIGNWKLLVRPPAAPMLFDLANDIGEREDLAAKHPNELARLTAAFDEWQQPMLAPRWTRDDAADDSD